MIWFVTRGFEGALEKEESSERGGGSQVLALSKLCSAG